jgi:hypothetical protein
MLKRTLLVLAAALVVASFTVPATAASMAGPVAMPVLTSAYADQLRLRPHILTAADKAQGAAGPVGILTYTGPRACDAWLVPSGLYKLSHCAAPYFFGNQVQGKTDLHAYRRDCTSTCPWGTHHAQSVTINDAVIAPLLSADRHYADSVGGTGVASVYGPVIDPPTVICGEGAFATNYDESFRSAGGTAFYGPGWGTTPELVQSPSSDRPC